MITAMAGRMVPGFEIFSEFVNELKVEVDEEVPIEELITGLGSDEGIVTMEPKEAGDHNKELDFETFINNSFIDVLL